MQHGKMLCNSDEQFTYVQGLFRQICIHNKSCTTITMVETKYIIICSETCALVPWVVLLKTNLLKDSLNKKDSALMKVFECFTPKMDLINLTMVIIKILMFLFD